MKRYTRWVLKWIWFNDPEYDDLMSVLDDIEYKVVIPMDENRLEEGRYLRTYCTKSYSRKESDPVSVLEVLAAFAYRMTHEWLDGYEDRTEDFFFELVSNLGLKRYKNKVFEKNPERAEEAVREVVRIWLDREFSEDGVGGIMPVYKSKRDQRDLQMWDQFMDYSKVRPQPRPITSKEYNEMMERFYKRTNRMDGL